MYVTVTKSTRPVVITECDAAQAKEMEVWKEAIKTSDPEDPVVCLLDVTCKAARAQAEEGRGCLSQQDSRNSAEACAGQCPGAS